MKLLLAILILVPGIAFGRCIPKNNYYIPESVTSAGIGKPSYDRVLDQFEAHYRPVIKRKGFNLVVNRLWSDGTVNSDTTVQGRNFVINSYGGLARFQGMTATGYLLVACHELGHHLGGAPIYSGGAWPGGGAAVEGEADYWATLDCMKDMGYGPPALNHAAQTLSDILAVLGGEGKPSPGTPDQSTVDQTYEDHPQAQCRLDTYLAGEICPARGVMSNVDPRVHSCWGGVTGSRPRCWFAP